MKSPLSTGQSAAILAILAIALPVVPLVASLPSPPMFFGVLNDFAHAIVFGALAVVTFELLRRCTTWPAQTRYLVAFVASVGAGGAVELIQSALGRSAELVDLRTDGLGAVAGLAIAALAASQRRLFSGIVLIFAAGIVVWPVTEASFAYWERSRQFPAVLEMTSPLDSYFILMDGFDSSSGALPARWSWAEDPPSLRLRVVNGRHSLTHAEPPPDWSGYKRLMMDLTNADSRPLTLTVRVHDRAHDNHVDDRFNRRLTLAPEARTVFAIPLTEIADSPAIRKMDLSAIAGLIIFGRNEPQSVGREYYLTRIWLE